MPDDPKTQSEPNTQLLGNDPATRNPDGSMKDPTAASQPQSTPQPDQSLTSTSKTEAPTETPKAPEGAPEKYADFKAPEGYALDTKTMESITPVFKEMGLSQDQAQKLVDFYVEQSKQANDAPLLAYRDLRGQWRDEIAKSDLGNGTDNLKPEVAAAVSQAIDNMSNPTKFRAMLDLSGMGDNPDFIRGFYELAKSAGEGTGVRGGGPAPTGQQNPAKGPRTAAQAIYPHLPSAS